MTHPSLQAGAGLVETQGDLVHGRVQLAHRRVHRPQRQVYGRIRRLNFRTKVRNGGVNLPRDGLHAVERGRQIGKDLLSKFAAHGGRIGRQKAPGRHQPIVAEVSHDATDPVGHLDLILDSRCKARQFDLHGCGRELFELPGPRQACTVHARAAITNNDSGSRRVIGMGTGRVRRVRRLRPNDDDRHGRVRCNAAARQTPRFDHPGVRGGRLHHRGVNAAQVRAGGRVGRSAQGKVVLAVRLAAHRQVHAARLRVHLALQHDHLLAVQQGGGGANGQTVACPVLDEAHGQRQRGGQALAHVGEVISRDLAQLASAVPVIGNRLIFDFFRPFGAVFVQIGLRSDRAEGLDRPLMEGRFAPRNNGVLAVALIGRPGDAERPLNVVIGDDADGNARGFHHAGQLGTAHQGRARTGLHHGGENVPLPHPRVPDPGDLPAVRVGHVGRIDEGGHVDGGDRQTDTAQAYAVENVANAEGQRLKEGVLVPFRGPRVAVVPPLRAVAAGHGGILARIIDRAAAHLPHGLRQLRVLVRVG